MNSTVSETRSAGRPRDRRIDGAVLAATRELLVADGYTGLTIAAVATRAATTAPAIYRRWPTKVHLVHAAAFPEELAADVAPTGDPRVDLEALVRNTATLFSDPVVRAAVPGLVGDLAQHQDLHHALMDQLWGSHLIQLQRSLDDGAEAGLVRAGLRADHLLGVVGGSALLGVLTPSGQELDDTWIAATTRLLLEGMTP